MNALILDTETTDIETPEVIELAWMDTLNPENRSLTRYKPLRPPKWGALAVHHILMSELEHQQPAARAPSDVPLVDYWIGHNIDFDWRALGQPPVKRICTMAMARHLWPECDSHTLTAMTYFTQGANAATREKVKNAHSALHDVQLCAELLDVIRVVAKVQTIEALYEFSERARIPSVWAFGKFKGQSIGAADRGYANWCRKQPDFDPYVLEALRRAGL